MIDIDHLHKNMAAGYPMRPYVGDVSETFAPYVPLPGYSEKTSWPQTSSPIDLNKSSPSNRSEEEDENDDEFRPFTPPPPRERLSYTRYQLEMLNNIFARVKYPNSTQKQLIAKRVGITREQVKIWFQNRRRKDVVNKKTQPKDQDSDGNKSDQSDTKSDNGDSDSGVSTGDISGDAPQDDSESPMVPDVVMKSVIAELKKFENDPLKCKKLRKKMKAARKKEKKMSTQMKTMVISAAYDMISPPNQVISSTGMAQGVNKFNHSKEASAFGVPKETSPRVPNYQDNIQNSAMGLLMPRPINSTLGLPAGHHPAARKNPVAPGLCDLPVLSDLLSNSKANQAQGPRCVNTPTSPVSPLNGGYVSSRETSFDSTHGHRQAYQHNFMGSPVSLGRVYPFPFVAESPVPLSTIHVRHYEPCLPHHPYQPQDHHLFQPFSVSSFHNPYFSPSSTGLMWGGHSHNPSENNGSFIQM